jgi:hypothetical protein
VLGQPQTPATQCPCVRLRRNKHTVCSCGIACALRLAAPPACRCCCCCCLRLLLVLLPLAAPACASEGAEQHSDEPG